VKYWCRRCSTRVVVRVIININIVSRISGDGFKLENDRAYANYKDKATTKKADLLNDVSDFVPKLKVIAPVIKIADNLRKKITDPIMKRVNDIDL